MTVKDQIQHILDTYSTQGNKDILKSELEILVLLAERGQIVECKKWYKND